MTEILDSDIAQFGGYTTTAAAITFNILDWIGHMNINETIQTAASSGALIFLVYKIYNAHLDAKIKRKKLKNDELEKDS